MEKEKVNLFDFLKSISETKESMLDLEDFNKQYPAFMINRFLSASRDTIFFANIMTQMSHLPENLQYAFLFNGIDKKKRYFHYGGKGTAHKSKEIECVVKYYSCNKEQALDYINLMTEEQLQNIKDIYEPRICKGNIKNG
jgi:hypothetical protein